MLEYNHNINLGGVKMARLVTKTIRMILNEEGKPVKGVVICRDEFPLNPREEFDNLGTMVCWHNRYLLGDEHRYTNPRHFLHTLASYEGLSEDEAENMNIIDMISYLEQHNYVFLPLYLYNHSGLAMNTKGFTCPWDSGQVGWIYVAPEKIKEVYGNITKETLKKAKESLINEVSIYNMYLQGYVWGFECINENGEVVDSCYGYFGITPEESGILNDIPKDFQNCPIVISQEC